MPAPGPRLLAALPTLAVAALVGAGLAWGPIPQWDDYHALADRAVWLGIPHAGDVLSNLPFALVALWGLARVPGGALGDGRTGYRLFLWALLATAGGSTWYHWAPDDARLVWDRIPIALACGGLLAAVHAETRGESTGGNATAVTLALAVFAVASVLWWRATGDLRPYALLQLAPLILIPLWQWTAGAPQDDRRTFGAAILVYVLAKGAELADHAIATVAPFSGHTLKHLLAALAAALIVGRLASRRRLRNKPATAA